MIKLKPESIRMQVGLSRDEFAKKIGIGCVKTYQNKIKNGKWSPQSLEIMAEMIGGTIADVDWQPSN